MISKIYYIKNKKTGEFILGEANKKEMARKHGIIEWSDNAPKEIRLATQQEINFYYASRGKNEVRKFI